MKTTPYTLPIVFLFLFIGIMPRSYAQTPKEIELSLKLARFIGIKVCDSYTLSYFIKEDIEGKPVYNNGLLVQNAKQGKIQSKKWRNQKMIPLQNFYTQMDTIVTETIQQSDSIYQYVTKDQYKIKVENQDLIYKYQFHNNPKIKSLNFPRQDSIFSTVVQVTKDLKGNTIKQWNQNSQVQKKVEPKVFAPKIDTLNYLGDSEKLFLYELNEESEVISKSFIGLDQKEEGVIVNVSGESFSRANIGIIGMGKLSNISYLVEFRTEGEDYQINYTVDENNNLQSFIYQKAQHSNPVESIVEMGCITETRIGFAIEYNFIANAFFLCN